MAVTSAQAALGALLGAAAGDAAGAVLEFLSHAPSEAEVAHALTMPGGGCWKVDRGQITDDTELALAQADGLLAGGGVLDLDAVAASYRHWFLSPPFDIGNTTAQALGDADCGALAMSRRASLESKANGALMRATPLGVWASRLSSADAFSAGVLDAMLTHPSVAGANGAYVCAIAHLVGRPGDAEGAAAAAEAQLVAGSHSEPLAWLHLARSGQAEACHPNAGFAKIAFTHAFRHLLRRTPYRQALEETLAGGGDTDTNAAIVGGLLGALHGSASIPPQLTQPLLACDTSSARGGARGRPPWLRASRLPELAAALAAAAPAVLRVRPDRELFRASQERLGALMQSACADPGAWTAVLAALRADRRLAATAARSFVQPFTGRSFLHAAAMAACRPACHFLISRGAALHARDACGKQPAELCPDSQLAAALREAAGSCSEGDAPGAEAAHYARVKSCLWNGATPVVAARPFPIHGLSGISVRAGETYYVDVWGRVLVGWHGSVCPPNDMDGMPMFDDA